MQTDFDCDVLLRRIMRSLVNYVLPGHFLLKQDRNIKLRQVDLQLAIWYAYIANNYQHQH